MLIMNFILSNNNGSIDQERNNRSWLIIVHSASLTRRVMIGLPLLYGSGLSKLCLLNIDMIMLKY